jgi:hypothetical protein
MFFFEKKNQKTSVPPRFLSGQTMATQKPGTTKSFFASFFSKKEDLPKSSIISLGEF